ncbi:MAG: hypothetical protein A3F84_13935 [Candidatus Handelsmanbacteria bacterium RIFCSPLOWO2_12_FULL_64_10]|uniref:Uncharacterized protein n=1 Tax=Handelsmanbacteria sp. (strain RIFCSPLOWO2_12_FULL_64_10) TaxID=1817868 RepID=A0A1F6CDI2_HANXR|nr:MAG: hypothetical protein A3F84_13935 [Candidatus Handelsmanbacteria bacterium RIFCSPLOWO2_12_FULL_64_10]
MIGGVADRVPERIRALVYLDAFVLESGENLAQHVPEPQYKQMLEAVQAVGEGWKVPPIPAEVFNVNATDREWVNRQCTMQRNSRSPFDATAGASLIEGVRV